MIAYQEEAASLDVQWIKEYGPTWRIQGAFGVEYTPQSLLPHRN